MSKKSLPHNLVVLSYNLRFHMAYEEAFTLAEKSRADVICLQECYTDLLEKRVGNYELAGKTRGPLGLAIYYRTSRLIIQLTKSHTLTHSFYERITGEKGERLLMAKFEDSITKRPVFIASFHATHLVASNSHRRKQLKEVFDFLEQHNPAAHRAPVIVAGDYNYPWFHARLRNLVEAHNYTLHVSKGPTLKNSVLEGRFDLISARHVGDIDLRVLDRGISDHMAICATVQY